MGTGNYNTVIGSGITVPTVSNNIILADGQGNQRIRIFNTGNTLIGYTAFADSGYKLDVNGSIRSMGAVRLQGLTTNNTLTNILASDASGNISWRDASTLGGSGPNLNNWSITGNTGINPSTAFIGTTDNQPVIIRSNNTERLRVDGTGNVIIGSSGTTDTAYKLFVKKGIRTRRVKVDLGSWSDYVFDTGYKLPTLAEVQEYINQHKHLQGVPSAQEVQKNGLDVGENQAVLLKKIEELTLYVIEQNKKIGEQQDQINELRTLIKKK